MRNYFWIDQYLNRLESQIYPQPPDDGHTLWAQNYISKFLPVVHSKTVLDIGCGQGFCASMFEEMGVEWTGVTLGQEDFDVLDEKFLPAFQHDFSFLEHIIPESYDIVFARHALEHSPMPLLTLMEWARVARYWLMLVAPAPEYWSFRGRNHYSVMTHQQLEWLLELAGWKIVKREFMDTFDEEYMVIYTKEFFKEHGKVEKPPRQLTVEYRYLCVKEGKYVDEQAETNTSRELDLIPSEGLVPNA